MAKASRTPVPVKAGAKAAPKAAAATVKPKAPVAKAAAAKPKAATVPVKASAKPAAKAPAKAAAGKTASTTKPAAVKPAAKAAATKAPPAAKPAEAAAKRLPKALTALAAGLPEKPWLKSYPKNVPAEIGPLPYSSIGDFLVGACKQFSAQPAFTCMDKSISYTDVERLSAAFGAYLQSKGLQKGARVALMMPNVLQYPVAMMAVLRAGYVVVNINPLYTPRELEHQLKDSGAQAIVILENFANTLEAVIARTAVKNVVVAAMGDMLGGLKGTIVNFVVRRVKKMVPAWSLPGHIKFNAAVKAGAGATFKPAKVSADDVAFLQYTGGTTGVSKGATLLHRNVLANVVQNAQWMEDAYTFKPKPAHPNFICALPLYHIFALTVNALMGMQQGARNVLIPNPRDIPGFVKELQKYPVHIFPGLNTLFNALLNNEDFRKLDFKPLVLTLGGGMAVQKGVAERWKTLTGCPVTEGYGLSETSPVATANKFTPGDFTGTIGLPLPSTEIAIRDDDGNNLPLGEVGEICIRGPQVMAGYWNRPDETARVMTKDGYFKSGDMGFMDERGYTKIVDRKKDMILVSGFNVYPNELEEVVAMHPGVLEVAAIGVPDEHSGEVPKLFVVKKDPALTAETLTAYCRENLTGYKRPKYIEFRTELPKTPVGKILRRALRE
ncbi:long-chain fatty acid--CoA ligase [Mesorhizobium sp. Root695]|uniref:long-chain fatty acid--CoA ligase n=1 Tax=unclassified Mesorhizobium TaxID=325217 RepID=UPI0006F1ED5D|nr:MULTISPECIES: long-chain fatty acid--CoA ligase [unclassified Mesorhizobium]KQU89244.1 long-chain fatty acid--CoA ligase [Mesorhizobium sp. Root102]KRB24556.1 long-chain fatty acid--CoA ligase [Mesorhizobium sp. Root695]